MRLPREAIAAVREEAGRDFLLGCRYLGSEDILGEDGSIRGNTLEDAKRIGVELCRAGLDFLSISRGGKFDDAKQPPVGEAAYPYTGHSGRVCIPRGKKDPFGVNTFLATGIREAVRAAGFAVPVVTAGKIHTFEQAESILREERADLVGMARALLADPDLPRKWRDGREAEVRACVFCPTASKRTSTTAWSRAVCGRRTRRTRGVTSRRTSGGASSRPGSNAARPRADAPAPVGAQRARAGRRGGAAAADRRPDGLGHVASLV
jgi:2,4-dienoyl-CoA reductase-like NADH-dependent reductase (Old Yellow Enzyme family)